MERISSDYNSAGGIGQPLSLLLKLSPLVTDLALYDVVNAPGVATDLSHISTHSTVTGYLPADDGMKKALTGADIVVVPAGLPRKPGMTRDDLFQKNASIVRDIAKGIAEYSPKAVVLIISNPVNSTVPIVAEVLKEKGVFEPKRLFGVTTLDVVRASTFTATVAKGDPTQYTIPVVGGHSGVTILPLISQSVPEFKGSQDEIEALTKRIQFGGDEVVKAKDGAGSATLSMAYAGFRFAEAVLKAKSGKSGIVEPAFVYLPGVPGGEATLKQVEDIEFFSVPVELGVSDGACTGCVCCLREKQTDGVAKAKTIGSISEFEKKLLAAALPELKSNIEKGVAFVKSSSKLYASLKKLWIEANLLVQIDCQV